MKYSLLLIKVRKIPLLSCNTNDLKWHTFIKKSIVDVSRQRLAMKKKQIEIEAECDNHRSWKKDKIRRFITQHRTWQWLMPFWSHHTTPHTQTFHHAPEKEMVPLRNTMTTAPKSRGGNDTDPKEAKESGHQATPCPKPAYSRWRVQHLESSTKSNTQYKDPKEELWIRLPQLHKAC